MHYDLYYNLIKAFHIISVIAWTSALLYLPRLFVYHTTASNPETQQTLQKMEKRLHLIIMSPAMIASLVFGLWMIILNPSLLSLPWFHTKLGLIAILIGVHHLFGKWRKDFIYERNRHSPRFFRIVNEVPTLIMIMIVVLVVIKPSFQ